MPPRFHVPTLDPAAGTAALEGEEAHHLLRVMRMGPGDRVLVFDGRGGQVLAEIASVHKTSAELRILEPAAAAAELGVAITIAQAVLKGDRMDAVVRDVTMMGAVRVQPVISAHAAVPARALKDVTRAVDRWRRVAVASAKQCGRAVVPHIAAPCELGEAVAGGAEACRLMLTEPAAGARDAGDVLPIVPPRRATLLAGPEGGWHADEVSAALAMGWTPWRLGHTTIRADAVALAALGAMVYAWRSDH